MARRALLIAMWLAVAATVGCSTRPKAVAVPPAAPSIVPFVYSSLVAPDTLNDAQRDEIEADIAEATTQGRQVWFAYVRSLNDEKYRASVYFRPIELVGRIRRGEVLYLDTMTRSVEDRRRAFDQLGADWPAYAKYVQVAAAAAIEDEGLPREPDMPFEPPKGLTDDELARLIDTARSAAITDDPKNRGLPICSIDPNADGGLDVMLGRQLGPLNGGGRYVRVKRDGKAFKVVEVGMWVS